MNKSILVICEDIVLTGGLLRFERLGRELQKLGHNLTYVTLTDNPNPQWQSEFEILSYDEAILRSWDISMVPGAGFSTKAIEKFNQFLSDQFGLRIQHILNGCENPKSNERFLSVNRFFEPDIVIFNNEHWKPGSFTHFKAKKFAYLIGAVDTQKFAPDKNRKFPQVNDIKTIGGLANKNPILLLEAIKQLPDTYRLKLIGNFSIDQSDYHDLIQTGKIEFIGPIAENDLPDYFKQVDCIVHPINLAGWANLVAEAMSSGIPVICTKHGTLAIAENNKTAIVIDNPSPDKIKEEIIKIFENEETTIKMTREARNRILGFSWKEYTSQFLEICKDNGKSHYTFAPELGLYGKWPLSKRFQGLDEIFTKMNKQTIIDFGSAEGVIALKCYHNGAKLVHGFDIEPSRVDTAKNLCIDYPTSVFRIGDITNWKSFLDQNSDLLLNQYDIVLYLGVHHHINPAKKLGVLKGVLALTKNYFVIRTIERLYEEDDLISIFHNEGFVEITNYTEAKENHLGTLKIFQRKPQKLFGLFSKR